MLTLNPFASRLFFHTPSFPASPSRDSAIRTKSSAYSSSNGRPSLQSLDSASITITKSSGLNADHKTSLGTLSNAFSRSTKAIHNSLRFCRYFSCTCLTTNTASVVPLPGINPKCMSSMQILPSIIFLLSLASTTLSNTFSPCSNNFTPLYDPHSRASPLPLYILTIQLLLQSSGIFPSLTTSLHSSVILLTPSSPIALNISATTPVGPAAFSSFI